MTDSKPNAPDTKIDKRSLHTRAGMRGAIGGFCWSLIVAVPLALVFWNHSKIGPLWALFAFVTTCTIWTIVAAFVNIGRTHEKSFPEVRRQSIDTRSLVARGAVRGAFGGFCWSLLVGVPLAFMFWNVPNGGPIWGMFSLGLTSIIWTGIAANVGAGKSREKTFTDEQRAVLHRRTRRSALQGLCFALPVAAFILVITWGYGPIGAIVNASMVLGIWVGSAALVGHGLGKRSVRAPSLSCPLPRGPARSGYCFSKSQARPVSRRRIAIC